MIQDLVVYAVYIGYALAVLMTFGTAEGIGGNGYLAVYLCGILLNGTNFVHKRHVVRFHSGLAWLMQIVMFLVLGLLVFPSQLPGVAPSGLMVVLVLMSRNPRWIRVNMPASLGKGFDPGA